VEIKNNVSLKKKVFWLFFVSYNLDGEDKFQLTSSVILHRKLLRGSSWDEIQNRNDDKLLRHNFYYIQKWYKLFKKTF